MDLATDAKTGKEIRVFGVQDEIERRGAALWADRTTRSPRAPCEPLS
jgi:hypothetical protein